MLKLKVFADSLLWVFDHSALSSFRACSRRKDMMKPCDGSWDWSLLVCLSRKDFKVCFVFLQISYWMFVPTLVFFHNFVIVSSRDDLREERNVVWHCWNLKEGSWKAWPKFLWEGIIELIVAEIGRSGHWRTYFMSMLSKFSDILKIIII